MTATVPKTIDLPPDGAEMMPVYIDPERVVTPADNPAYSPAMLADLVESFRQYGQLVPGWVCPSPDLPEDRRLCLEGNRRLAVARMLGLQFWAFDHGRFVPEEERIRRMFHHHGTRRRMSREEIARRAARYMELTGCTAAEAAKHLNVSEATLSRIFGEKRIPPELKAKAEQLAPTIRSLVAAAPLELMSQVVEFALTPRPDGKRRTRDEVAGYGQQLKKQSANPKGRKPKAITLRMNGRAVTLTIDDRDSAASVAEDLRAIVARLGKHADVPPDGWPFLFQQ